MHSSPSLVPVCGGCRHNSNTVRRGATTATSLPGACRKPVRPTAATAFILMLALFAGAPPACGRSLLDVRAKRHAFALVSDSMVDHHHQQGHYIEHLRAADGVSVGSNLDLDLGRGLKGAKKKPQPAQAFPSPSPSPSPSPRPPPPSPRPPSPSPSPRPPPPSPRPPSPRASPSPPPSPRPSPSPPLSSSTKQDSSMNNTPPSSAAARHGLGPGLPAPPVLFVALQAAGTTIPSDGNPNTPGDGFNKLPAVPCTDPELCGEFTLKAVGNVVAVHMCAVPGTDKFFFMERPSGRHPDGSHDIAGYYDYNANKFTNVAYKDSVFCAGHTVTQDGHVLVVGGHIAKSGFNDGLKGVRIFSRKTLTFHRIANLTFPRWYPTATLLPDGSVTIMGGTVLPGSGTGKNPIYEVWSPHRPTTTTKFNQSAGMIKRTNDIYYPNNYVLPSGDLFSFCNRYGEITKPLEGKVVTTLPGWDNLKGIFTEYPFTGTSVMLPLTPENDYTAEVIFFGGQYSYAWINTTASVNSMRIRVEYDSDVGNYTFGDGWVPERMPLARVMGDCIVLPNGQVIVLNGALKGLAGDSAQGGVAKANEPNVWAVQYDSNEPLGSRYKLLARSRIPRLYHSVAALTTDGSILVAGCDRCDKYWWTTPDGISKSPTSFAEYRIEVFRPPVWFNVTAKPNIVEIDNSTWDGDDGVNVMQYGQPFALRYEMFFESDSVTSAVLVAPSSTTHSTNMHQRVVGLEILVQDTANRRLILSGPPTINIAPPGWYMLFLLNGKVYGQAVWVRLPGGAPRLDYLIQPTSSTSSKSSSAKSTKP